MSNNTEAVNVSTGEIMDIEPLPAGGLTQDIQRLQSGESPVYSSIKGDDRESRLTVLKAMTDSTPLDNMRDKEFSLANFVVQPILLKDNENNDRLVEAPRVILVTSEGKAYHAVSTGIFSAITNICGIFGEPHGNSMWPVKVKMVEEKTNAGWKVFTLKVTG